MTPARTSPARFLPRRAALALADAWREGTPIGPLPAGHAPRTAAQAWRVVGAMLRELDQPAVGFRALPDGSVGPLLATRLVASGITLPSAALPGLLASAAAFFPLARALPPSASPYTLRRVLAALGPGRAAVDLSAWRTLPPPESLPARIADLGGLGMVVLGQGARGRPDPAVLRLSWRDGPPATRDIRPLLLAAAEAARHAGGLPAGAALVAAGLADTGDGPLACRIVGGGLAQARLA